MHSFFMVYWLCPALEEYEHTRNVVARSVGSLVEERMGSAMWCTMNDWRREDWRSEHYCFRTIHDLQTLAEYLLYSIDAAISFCTH